MGLLFWKKEKEFKPSLSERIAAYHPAVRILILPPMIAAIIGILYVMLDISLIGVDLIQANEKIKETMRIVSAIPSIGLVLLAVFASMAKGAKRDLIIVSIIGLAALTNTYEGIQFWKSRSATIIEQDIGAEAHDSSIDLINGKIEAAEKSAAHYESELNKAKTKKCFKWEQLQCDANTKDYGKMFEAKKSEVAKLKEERLAIPKRKPTEKGIMGEKLTEYMAILIVVILLAFKWICSSIVGLVLASFSIHKANKFVRENQSEVEIKRPDLMPKAPPPEEPKRPVVPAEKPAAPPKIEAGELPANQRGALAAAAAALASATAAPAFADNTATGSGQNIVENQQVGGSIGGGSGGGSVEVGGKTATAQESDGKSVEAVALPRITYSEFMESEAARRKLRDVMRSGE